MSHSAVLPCLPAEIDRIESYKRDEITTDLICYEISAGGQIWHYHEEWEHWDRLIQEFENFPEFNRDWFAKVLLPPFTPSNFIF